MPRKREPHPLEHIGLLVMCPTCHIGKGSYCIVTRTPFTHNIGKPAAVMHEPRIRAGQKWQDWHKGLPPRMIGDTDAESAPHAP